MIEDSLNVLKLIAEENAVTGDSVRTKGAFVFITGTDIYAILEGAMPEQK